MCLAIVIFIFLTPKAWFEKSEKLATQPEKIIVQAGDLSPDKDAMEKRVREVTGRNDAKVIGFTEKSDEAGRKYYEIIIR